MEPWITVAVKRGHKIVCGAFSEGAAVSVPSIDPAAYASIDRAVRTAVDKTNAGIEPSWRTTRGCSGSVRAP
jgi:hypothetical protein